MTGPTPGSASSCSTRRGAEAHRSCRGRADAGPGRGRPRRDGDPTRHQDLHPVGERRGEVDRRGVGLRGRSARTGDRVGDSFALGQPVEARAAEPRRRRAPSRACRRGRLRPLRHERRGRLGGRRRRRRRACAPRARAARAGRPRRRARGVARPAARACHERWRRTCHACVTASCRVRDFRGPRRRAAERSRYTTKFTSLPGTTIVLRGSPPFRCACTRSEPAPARRAPPRRSRPAPRSRSRSLPFTCSDELERLALEQRLVGLRPRLLPQPLVAEPLPQLLGDVRRVRLDQRDRRLGGEPRGRIVRRCARAR